MTKTVKALLVSLGALGLIGTGFAAWNITITGETKVERPLSPDTDGTQTLVAQGLDVSEDPTLTFHPNSGAQLAHYVVKAVDTSWYSKVNLLDASEEKVSLKVSFAGTSTNSKWEDRIAIDHAEERIFVPGTWLASSEGYSVDWNFSWKGIGAYANPAEYAQATYATPESQKEYLDAVSADLEGLQFTFTFDLVANTPVGPVNPDPDPVVTTVNASLSETTLDIGGTSNLTVSTNLGTPDSYSIVDKSENYDSVVSFSDGVFTAVAAGTASFKVQVGDVKSEQLSITVNEATPEPTINYGTAENPLDVATALSTIEGLELGSGQWSEDRFYIRGTVKSVGAVSSTYISDVYLTDGNGHDLYIKSVNKNNDTAFDQNDIITVNGFAEFYNDQLMIAGHPSSNHAYPEFSNWEAGISTITVTAEHATVVGLEDGEDFNGETQTFMVEAESGYDLVSVKVNNKTVTPVNDEYSFVLHGDTTVVVTTEMHSDDPTPTSDPVTVSTTIADYATAHEWTNSTQYEAVALDNNITATATGSSNTGKYYTSGNSWRFYANENATLTISVSGSYSLSSVTITYTIQDSGTLSFSENAVASGDAVSVSGNSATFTIGSSSGSKGKVFVTAISVTYVAA